MSRARGLRTTLLASAALFFLSQINLSAQNFVRVTDPNNPIAVDQGDTGYNGASWIDYDNDGLLDLFVNRGKLYHNEGNGNFTRVENHGLGANLIQGLGSGNSWADFDNDGDLDCFYSGARSKLYRNDGGGTFTPMNAGEIGAEFDTRGWACAWADYDNDGLVDLLITHPANFVGAPTTNHLFHNEGAGRFSRVTNSAVVTGLAPYTVGIWADYDDDGDQDLFIGAGPANGTVAPDFFYQNMLKETGTATLQRITNGAFAIEPRDGQNYNWIDYDNDGDLDMYLTNYSGITSGMVNHMYRNDAGALVKITTGAIVTDREVSLGNIWGDFDNDGDLDCFVTNEAGAPNRYYVNNGDGTFTRRTDLPFLNKPGASNNAGATAGDYDNDGDLDLFMTGQGNAFGLYRNTLGSDNYWLQIQCEGTLSNRAAIGASVRVKATIFGASVWQRREISAQNGFNSHNSLRAHFGLADAMRVDSLVILWPSGAREVRTNVAANQILTVTEKLSRGLKANFTADILEGPRPLTVRFTDLSLHDPSTSINSWAWDFNGDGVTDAQEQNPAWTFQRAGKYTVRLSITSSAGSDAFVQNDLITVLQFGKATASEIALETASSQGSSWADVDGDGDLDLFITNAANQNEFLYLNHGDGTFAKNTTSAIANDGNASQGASWGDYDNDGDWDLYIANFNQANALFENSGNGVFTKVTTGAIATDREISTGCSWVDIDNDGDLDMFVANLGTNESLYRNNGDRTFTKITDGSIVNDRGFSQNASWADYDNDGDMDVFVANDRNENNGLYSNNGDGTFVKITSGPVANDGGNSFGGSWGDYDNDGDLDLFVANAQLQNDFLYRNNGDGSFTKITEGPVVNDGASSQASGWSDFDNDGDIDLFVTTAGGTGLLYENDGTGNFTRRIENPFQSDLLNGTSASWGDYDNDGDVDLFVSANGANSVLYRNTGGENHWLKITCVGVTSNTSGLGAKVRVKATINGKSYWQMRQIAAQSGYNSQSSLLADFGLGAATTVDSIKIEWPSRAVDILANVVPGSYLIKEGSTTAVSGGNGELPLHFVLQQNYPNPFNPATTIEYALAKQTRVSLRIFNLLGEEVAHLVDREQAAGVHRVQWNGKDARGQALPSGIYLYKIATESFTQTKRLLLIK